MNKCKPFTSIDLDESAEQPCSVPCVLHHISAINLSSSWIYLKIYDKASAATEADTPVLVYPIPTGGGVSVTPTKGVAMANGVSVRATTGVAHNSTGAPGANELVFNCLYDT